MTVRYTKEGLWIEEIGDKHRIGLSVKGQDDVGEVMFVELPKFKEHVEIGDNLIIVEGAKAVTEIVVPVSGTFEKVHTEVEDDYSLLNAKDREDTWILELSDVLGFNSAEFSEDPWFGDQPTENEEE